VGAKQDLLQNIKKSYGIELEDEFDKKAVAYLRVEEMVQNAVNDMIETFKKQQADKDGKGKKSAEQVAEFEQYLNQAVF
jgi:predicted acetyltransferase